MTHVVTPYRAHEMIDRLDAWAHRGRVRSLLLKIAVTVVGPLVVLAGIAMTVLPGPGLLVIAFGLALLALEYDWARRVLRFMGRRLSEARQAALPKGGSPQRRALGVAVVGAIGVASFALTAVVTTFVGAQTIL
jgi:uncharacterized protein (TIGR02611 family)